MTETNCTKCHEEKQVYTDKPIFGGAASKKRDLDRAKGVKVGDKQYHKEEEKTGN